MTVVCQYCEQDAELVSAKDIYPGREHADASQKYWRCVACNAHAKCHRLGTYHIVDGKRIEYKGTEPQGTLAKPALRKARASAYAAFDAMWKHGWMRQSAYHWLAKKMGLKRSETGIGLFDIEQCHRVAALCTAELQRRNGIIKKLGPRR